MSSAVISGAFGLGGVLLGGAITMVSSGWQAANARKGRVAELELQLRHERFLRDETAKRSAILEFIAVLERFNLAVMIVVMAHGHGSDEDRDWSDVDCVIGNWDDVVAAATDFVQLMSRQSALINRPSSLEILLETWRDYYIYKLPMYDEQFKISKVDRKDYCRPGGAIACLEGPIQENIEFLQGELKNVIAS